LAEREHGHEILFAWSSRTPTQLQRRSALVFGYPPLWLLCGLALPPRGLAHELLAGNSRSSEHATTGWASRTLARAADT
jgi:hypothetical protein